MKLSEIDQSIAWHEAQIKQLEEKRREVINKAQRKVKFAGVWLLVQQTNDYGCYVSQQHYPVMFISWDEVEDKQGFDDE
ncbi:hypothetical protein [Proteus phage vB_PmiP_RS51pmB]|nr:hypothetical protein [Proteus phage vB_PmiP_RS51pmB]